MQLQRRPLPIKKIPLSIYVGSALHSLHGLYAYCSSSSSVVLPGSYSCSDATDMRSACNLCLMLTSVRVHLSLLSIVLISSGEWKHLQLHALLCFLVTKRSMFCFLPSTFLIPSPSLTFFKNKGRSLVAIISGQPINSK